MAALRGIQTIKGKPCLSADTMVALVLKSGLAKYFRPVSEETDNQRATYETLRVGDDKPTRFTYTMQMAQTAGLAGGDNWRKHPSAMLRARCKSMLARDRYSDVLAGLYSPAEFGEAERAEDWTEGETPVIESVAVPTDVADPLPPPKPLPAQTQPQSGTAATKEKVRAALAGKVTAPQATSAKTAGGAAAKRKNPISERVANLRKYCEENGVPDSTFQKTLRQAVGWTGLEPVPEEKIDHETLEKVWAGLVALQSAGAFGNDPPPHSDADFTPNQEK
jgi:hypothetical protein